MNSKQMNLLMSSGYEVLPDLNNFIKEVNNRYPAAYVYYDIAHKGFGLNIVQYSISPECIDEYLEEINKKVELVNKLNKLA